MIIASVYHAISRSNFTRYSTVYNVNEKGFLKKGYFMFKLDWLHHSVSINFICAENDVGAAAPFYIHNVTWLNRPAVSKSQIMKPTKSSNILLSIVWSRVTATDAKARLFSYSWAFEKYYSEDLVWMCIMNLLDDKMLSILLNVSFWMIYVSLY